MSRILIQAFRAGVNGYQQYAKGVSKQQAGQTQAIRRLSVWSYVALGVSGTALAAGFSLTNPRLAPRGSHPGLKKWVSAARTSLQVACTVMWRSAATMSALRHVGVKVWGLSGRMFS